jgi:hypothetical protein
MEKYKELAYIPRLSILKLKRIQAGYMGSCPICKEGSHPWKTRFYILTENKSHITVFCQRCSYNTNLRTFIKDTHPYLFEEYLAEEKKEFLANLKEGTLIHKEQRQSEINNIINLQYTFKFGQYFKPAAKYREAVEFCQKRHISEHIDKFYYNIHPSKIMGGMLIFPFLLEDQETLYGFQGRHTKVKTFFTHSKNEFMKVYNLYNVNLSETVYIFESIIDSLMVPNSIAMLGTTLSKPILDMIKHKVFIPDNDNVGKQRTLQYLKEGYRCFIFPDNYKYKDFNEAVCDGVKKSDLILLIKCNTFEGLLGETKIKFQMMRKK